ncbi:DM13 domain-containing protein [Thalassotalea piscium]
MLVKTILCSGVLFTLFACGGGGETQSDNTALMSPSTPQPTPLIYQGVFLDAAVANLHYQTLEQEGYTTETGEFNYQLNERIVFSIGDIVFPEVSASGTITPLEVFNTEDTSEQAVINMLRLLQSLDIDGDASNGITISDTAHELAKGLTVDFSADDFDDQVALLVAGSGSIYQALITEQDALYHFQETLDGLTQQTSNNCGSTHSKVGYTGYFESFAHNVSGRAEIINDCTIKITEFSYDGGGPEVYIYAAKNHDYQSDLAFPISQKINGKAYINAEITVRLPSSKSLDDLTGLSVWCVDFAANFGQVNFTP